MKELIKEAAIELTHHHVKAYYVGGCVRDEFMGLPVDDYDICLVGVTDKKVVEDILLHHFDHVTPMVGQSFPVWKARVGDQWVDFAMARKETLIGPTRKDFICDTDFVTLEEDLHRRDFTMNAIAKDVIHDAEYIDPFNGRSDISDGVLHYVDSETFVEDSLRVLRAARFCARFGLFLSPDLMRLCTSMKPLDISAERVGMELRKTMEQAAIPSAFFWFLRDVEWLGHHFKEVEDTIGVPQHLGHHPEGDVFVHTMLALDEATDPFIRICMLCHDLGKATTTTVDGWDWQQMRDNPYFNPKNPEHVIKSIGHEMAGITPTRSMLTRIHYADRKTIRQVEAMVELHMIRTTPTEGVIRRTLRKLMDRHLTYDQLVEVCRCDVSARPPLPKYTPEMGQERAKQLLAEGAMTPIVTGEKLLAAGYTPGKLIGRLVDKGLEWQDRGTLTEDNWLKMIKQYRDDPERVSKTP